MDRALRMLKARILCPEGVKLGPHLFVAVREAFVERA